MRGQPWLQGFYSSDRKDGNVINNDQEWRRRHEGGGRDEILHVQQYKLSLDSPTAE